MFLWRREGSPEQWRPIDIPSGGVALSMSQGRDLVVDPIGSSGLPGSEALAVVLPLDVKDTPRAVLAIRADAGARRQILVNGYPPLDLYVLLPRDELLAFGERLYFSAGGCITRGLFPDIDGEIRCSRCKTVLRSGDEAAQCVCQGWYHAGALVDTDEAPRDCLSYASTCLGCGRRWDDLGWSPGEEDE